MQELDLETIRKDIDRMDQQVSSNTQAWSIMPRIIFFTATE